MNKTTKATAAVANRLLRPILPARLAFSAATRTSLGAAFFRPNPILEILQS